MYNNNNIFNSQTSVPPLLSLANPNDAESEAITVAQIITGINDDASGITGLNFFIANPLTFSPNNSSANANEREGDR